MNKNSSKILCHLTLMSDTCFFFFAFFFLLVCVIQGQGIGRGLDIRLSLKLIKQFPLGELFCPASRVFLSFPVFLFHVSIWKLVTGTITLFDLAMSVTLGGDLSRRPLKPCQTPLSINVTHVSVTTCLQILNKLRLCFGKNRITLVSQREMLPYHGELQQTLAC